MSTMNQQETTGNIDLRISEQNSPQLRNSKDTDKSLEDNSACETQISCFMCQEKGLQDPECKICHNIASYRAKSEQHVNDLPHDENDNADISFPGPGIVQTNHIYGNYVVASRTIEPGELIILERPLSSGPYSPPEMLPLCLSCCKDIGLSSKCSQCKWPVCGKQCEQVEFSCTG